MLHKWGWDQILELKRQVVLHLNISKKFYIWAVRIYWEVHVTGIILRFIDGRKNERGIVKNGIERDNKKTIITEYIRYWKSGIDTEWEKGKLFFKLSDGSALKFHHDP